MEYNSKNSADGKPQKAKLSFKSLWQILKGTGSDFSNSRIMRMSAALAYYTVFSIAPMLILIISLSAIFYGKNAIEGSIYGEIKSFVGSDAALQIQDLIKSATIAKSNAFASGASIVALIIGATTVFGEIQDSINLIWGLKAKPKRGWVKNIIKQAVKFFNYCKPEFYFAGITYCKHSFRCFSKPAYTFVSGHCSVYWLTL